MSTSKETEQIMFWPVLSDDTYFNDYVHDQIVEPLIDLPTMCLWEDKDLFDHLKIYGPINEGIVSSNEQANCYEVVLKYTMSRYPLYSRCILNKLAYEELRSIIGRIYRIENTRRNYPETALTYDKICQAYFRVDYNNLIVQFASQPINFDAAATAEWLSHRPKADAKFQQTVVLLSQELQSHPISDIKINLKIESLLKEEYIMHWQKQQARIILW